MQYAYMCLVQSTGLGIPMHCDKLQGSDMSCTRRITLVAENIPLSSSAGLAYAPCQDRRTLHRYQIENIKDIYPDPTGLKMYPDAIVQSGISSLWQHRSELGVNQQTGLEGINFDLVHPFQEKLEIHAFMSNCPATSGQDAVVEPNHCQGSLVGFAHYRFGEHLKAAHCGESRVSQ